MVAAYNDITGNFLISRRPNNNYRSNYDNIFAPKVKPTTLSERFIGTLVGLAVGDALGTTVEFKPRGSFEPVTSMVGGGPFELLPGQYTDDTSMMLCLSDSLLANNVDQFDQLTRYSDWMNNGTNSSTGKCFDVGGITSSAIRAFDDGVPPDQCGGSSDYDSGNGGIMRMAPSVLYSYAVSTDERNDVISKCSATTHRSLIAIETALLMGEILVRALDGMPVDQLLVNLNFKPTTVDVQGIIDFDYNVSSDKISSGGYCVDTLTAAMWCILHTDNFADAVLNAVNLGYDADTTGAVTGQIAGALYGIRGIPSEFVLPLQDSRRMNRLGLAFYQRLKRD